MREFSSTINNRERERERERERRLFPMVQPCMC
jgi:hypothetical protein